MAIEVQSWSSLFAMDLPDIGISPYDWDNSCQNSIDSFKEFRERFVDATLNKLANGYITQDDAIIRFNSIEGKIPQFADRMKNKYSWGMRSFGVVNADPSILRLGLVRLTAINNNGY